MSESVIATLATDFRKALLFIFRSGQTACAEYFIVGSLILKVPVVAKDMRQRKTFSIQINWTPSLCPSLLLSKRSGILRLLLPSHRVSLVPNITSLLFVFFPKQWPPTFRNGHWMIVSSSLNLWKNHIVLF